MGLFNSSTVRGTLDNVQKGRVYGWVWDSSKDAPISVELLIDGVVVGNTLANGFRGDLKDAGIGTGHAAFSMVIPAHLCDSRFHEVEVRTMEGQVRLNGCPKMYQLVGPLNASEFKNNGTWIDAEADIFEAELERLRVSEGLSDSQLQYFRDFRRDGYIWLKGVIDENLLDSIVRDVNRAWKERPFLLSQISGEFPRQIATVEEESSYRARSARYLDLHNLSDAAAEVLCHPVIVQFIKHYFGAPIAGMQTLVFENGTQQRAHQDYPYVHSLRPAALAGAWVPLEDVSPDAGPLFYYPGSHHAISPYEFEGGSILAEGDGPHIREYESYLEEKCEALGLERHTLLAKKGDVLIWHAALVHGGSPRNKPELTRRSIVSHYTTQAAYPFDRRSPSTNPKKIVKGDCFYYGNQEPGYVEGLYKL